MSLSKQHDLSLCADLPKECPIDDELEFNSTAKNISKMLLSYQNDSSLVIAVNGPWGSGKTTMLNFIKHHIKKTISKKKHIIMDFNPWWFRDTDDLAVNFIKSLYTTIESNPEVESKKELLAKIKKYKDVIEFPASVMGYPGLGTIIKRFFDYNVDESDIHTLKNNIIKCIKNVDKRIIVFIDDLDRLSPSELHSVFRVVKAVADFPNVIYVLAFDRHIAAQTINVWTKTDGYKFLEKIVQLNIDMPKSASNNFAKILCHEIDKLLNCSDKFKGLNEDDRESELIRIKKLIHLHFINDIKSIRTVKRIANAIAIKHAQIGGIINTCDIVAMTVISEIYPDLHDDIVKNYKLYVQNDKEHLDKEEAQEHIKHMLQEFTAKYKANFASIVSGIFPYIDSITRNTYYSRDSYEKLYALCRICNASFMQLYISGVLPSGTIVNDALLEFLKTLSGDINKDLSLLKLFKDTTKTEGYIDIISRTKDVSHMLNKEEAEKSIGLIFQIADSVLNEEEYKSNMIPPSWVIDFAIISLFERIPSDNIKEFLLKTIDERNIPYVSSFVYSMILNQSRERDKQLSVPKALDNIETLTKAMDKITSLITYEYIQSLTQSKSLSRLVRSIIDHASLQTKSIVKSIFETKEQTACSLRQFTNIVISHSDITRIHEYLPLKTLEKIIDLDETACMLQEYILSTECPEDHAATIRMFLESYEIMQKGGDPDDGGAHRLHSITKAVH